MKHVSGPAVSVIMPVRNGEIYLDRALQSLARQSFADFETVVVDNGSTDGTARILRAWGAKEPRLRTVRIGRARLAEALNCAIGLARAPLLARLDADDIAFPDRLDVQVRAMVERPSLGLLGSAAALIDPRDNRIGELRLPVRHEDILAFERTSSAHIASSTIMRAEVFRAAGGYRRGLNVSEDFDLWTRVSEISEVANLPGAHIGYRVHSDSVTGRGHLRMAIASLCVAAAAEARKTGAREPFTRGIPTLRVALPLLGLTRGGVGRMVRARGIANGFMRALIASRTPVVLRRLAFRLLLSGPPRSVYRYWLTRAHGRLTRVVAARQARRDERVSAAP